MEHPAMRYIRSVDPEKAWRSGWRGWFLRVRGILLASGVDAALAVVSWILKFGWHLVAAVLIVGVAGVAGLIALRRVRLRMLHVACMAHAVIHDMRGEIHQLGTELVADMLSERGEEPGRYQVMLRGFHKSIANRIALYFRRLVGDQDVNCAIRLADKAHGQRQYRTAGRSDGMDPRRKDLSQPIPADDGIARLLRQRDRIGVHIVEDIAKLGSVPTSVENEDGVTSGWTKHPPSRGD